MTAVYHQTIDEIEVYRAPKSLKSWDYYIPGRYLSLQYRVLWIYGFMEDYPVQLNRYNIHMVNTDAYVQIISYHKILGE